MSSKYLVIYNSDTLFDILNEIKENLNFNIIKIEKNEFDKVKLNKFENFVIVSNSKNNLSNCHIIKTPLKINKIIEQINVFFLSTQFSSQSNISVGNYILDLNSREIIKNQNKLSLTEREIELILYIKANSPVSLKNLQQKVWKHVSELESHTVETHIYRLRKKFSEIFDDKNFIKFEKTGYYLN